MSAFSKVYATYYVKVDGPVSYSNPDVLFYGVYRACVEVFFDHPDVKARTANAALNMAYSRLSFTSPDQITATLYDHAGRLVLTKEQGVDTIPITGDHDYGIYGSFYPVQQHPLLD